MAKTLIFHVEDEPDDALFVQLAVDRAQADCEVHRAVDGREALDYLAGNGQFADRERYPLPQLMLLDLKLPLLDGFDVLAWIRSKREFQELPVVVLSGSDLEKDKEKALELGANSYVVKTPLYQDVVELVQRMFPTSGCSGLALPAAAHQQAYCEHHDQAAD